LPCNNSASAFFGFTPTDVGTKTSGSERAWRGAVVVLEGRNPGSDAQLVLALPSALLVRLCKLREEPVRASALDAREGDRADPGYLSQVRLRRKVPRPRHWQALRHAARRQPCCAMGAGASRGYPRGRASVRRGRRRPLRSVVAGRYFWV
jgi:hypothetical protein